MWFGVSKTSRIIDWRYGGPENATKHTTCDIATRRTTRALRGSRSVERARQHECSTDTCTRHLQLRSELRQSSPATLHSSRWQADGDLRCVTDSHEDGSPRGSGCKAWACERTNKPARGPLLSPFRKVLRARLRGRGPSTGWAGPCAVERTPSRVGQAPRRHLKAESAQPLRARSSHGLRKQARPNQLMIVITTICACRAGMRGSTRSLTFQLCQRNSNVAPVQVLSSQHVEDSSGLHVRHLEPAQLSRFEVLPRLT